MGCENGWDEFGVVNDSVQMGFQQVDQVFGGVVGVVSGFVICMMELFFGDVIVVIFQFLFGVQLNIEVGYFVGVVLVVLVWVVWMGVDWRFWMILEVFIYMVVDFVFL